MKQKSSLSVKFSLAAAIVALVAIAVLAVAIPQLSSFYLSVIDPPKEEYTLRYALIVCISYVGLVPVIAADIILMKLLRLASHTEVFTPRAADLLRTISFCCFCELAPVLALTPLLGPIFNMIVIPMIFIAIFLGCVLYVVADVLLRASVIKAENDLTV